MRLALGAFGPRGGHGRRRRGQLYLTEDRSDGRFCRSTPDAYPDLSSGPLEALAVDATGAVTWVPLLSQEQPQLEAGRPPGSAAFDGGEVVRFESDHVYFRTKGDNRVWPAPRARRGRDRACRVRHAAQRVAHRP